MKKLLTLLLALVFPTQVSAWESTIGLGYDHRHFDSNDQLGAVSPDKKLSPTHSSGLRLGGSLLWDIRDDYRIGPEIWLSQGWLSAPRQTGYITKTAGKVDTDDLTVQSVTVSAKVQVVEGGGHRLFLKPGFLVSNLTSGFSDRVDADTGAVLGFELASDLGKRNRFFVDVQAVFSPSTEGPRQFVLSSNLVLGVQWVFANEPDVKVQEPVKVPEPVKPEPPKQEKAPETLKVVDSPKPVELPKPATPIAAPEPPVLQVPPITVKVNPETQKVKGTLKLGPDGKLDPDSYPMIDKVVDVHNQKPSVIKILYKKEGSSQSLAEEIRNYIVSKGCPKDDVSLESSDTLEKPIKISVVPK